MKNPKKLITVIVSLATIFVFIRCPKESKDAKEEVATDLLVALTGDAECTITGTLQNDTGGSDLKNKTFSINVKPSSSADSIAVLTSTWGTNNNSHSFTFNVRHIPEGLYKLSASVNEGLGHTSDPTSDITMGCKGKKQDPSIPVEQPVLADPILVK